MRPDRRHRRGDPASPAARRDGAGCAARDSRAHAVPASSSNAAQPAARSCRGRAADTRRRHRRPRVSSRSAERARRRRCIPQRSVCTAGSMAAVGSIAGDLGNACGALVVSRHGCTPAMPSRVELEEFLARAPDITRPDLDDRLEHLHHATTVRRRPRGELYVLAFDHRRQLEQLADESGAPRASIARFKDLIAAAVERVAATIRAARARRRDRRCPPWQRSAEPAGPLEPVDRPTDRAARLAPAGVRSARRHGAAPRDLARRARHQVPGVLSPGRSDRAAPRAGTRACASCTRNARHAAARTC